MLQSAWNLALSSDGSSRSVPELAQACDEVFAGGEAGYKKAIVIQATGKAADPSLDAHAMQKGVGNPGSWDAREFAKAVFVPWNLEAGLPFGHAADPYVSNPYRIPRFDKSVRSQRKKPTEFDAALAVLDLLDSTNDPDQAFENLTEVVFALRRYIADRSVEYPLPNRASLKDTRVCVARFTQEKTGGTRLQAVVFALFRALAAQGMAYRDVKSRHVNASDSASKSAGDVSFQLGEASFAVEIKDRPLSKSEFEATVEKCRIAKVREVVFVIRATTLLDAEFSLSDFDNDCERQFSSGLNVYAEAFEPFALTVLTLLGESGRRAFLEEVGSALRDQNADIKHKWAWAALVKDI